MSKYNYQPVIVARIPSDIPTDQHAAIHAKIASLNATLKSIVASQPYAQSLALNALHGSGITACAYPDAIKIAPAKPRSGITYSVIVRNPNSWSAATGIHEELANCGHLHQSMEAAQACMEKLTAWHCLCGRTTKAYAPCCGTPRNSTSAKWHNAQVEPSGSDATGTDALPQYLRAKAAQVLDLAHNGHLMGTIAHATKLSPNQVDRILRAAAQK